MAYYADKNGKPTEKGKEWISKKKKEKVKKLRELAENLKPEEKEKVTNSEAAKQLEKSGLLNLATGAVSLGAGVASGIAANNIKSIKADGYDSIEGTVRNDIRYNTGGGYRDSDGNWISTTFEKKGAEIKFGANGDYGPYNGVFHTTNVASGGSAIIGDNPSGGKWVTYHTGDIDSKVTVGARISSVVMTALAAITGQLWLVMISSLLIGGVNTYRGIKNLNKSNVMRREEILQQLMATKKQE